MRTIIRKLPAPAVFCLVLFVCYWWAISANIVLVANRLRGITTPVDFADRNMFIMCIIELLGLAVMFWIGRIRGWSFATWGFQPSWRSTGAGVLLFLALYSVARGAGVLANAIHPGAVQSSLLLTSHLSLPFLILNVAVNPVFEETMETGFFVQSLQRYGMWIAVLASACFRASLHTYLGITAVVENLLAGLIFGFIYWKWRRLWPLFVAHALFDLNMFLRFHAA